MALVRFGTDGSDVYVYETASPRIKDGKKRFVCCGCADSLTAQEMIEHLRWHQQDTTSHAAGDCVPDYVFDKLGKVVDQ